MLILRELELDQQMSLESFKTRRLSKIYYDLFISCLLINGYYYFT